MKHQPADDELEAELHALRPRELPGRLVQGIEASLVAEGERGSSRRPALWMRVAGAAAGLAACVTVAAVLWSRGRGVSGPDGVPIVRTSKPAPTHVAAAGGQGQPGGATLGAYRAALARSPDAVDALLEQDARRPTKPAPRAASFRAFHGSALDLLGPDGP